nr:hypothetical protein CFP56_03350 [Quercus suber]
MTQKRKSARRSRDMAKRAHVEWVDEDFVDRKDQDLEAQKPAEDVNERVFREILLQGDNGDGGFCGRHKKKQRWGGNTCGHGAEEDEKVLEPLDISGIGVVACAIQAGFVQAGL